MLASVVLSLSGCLTSQLRPLTMRVGQLRIFGEPTREIIDHGCKHVVATDALVERLLAWFLLLSCSSRRHSHSQTEY